MRGFVTSPGGKVHLQTLEDFQVQVAAGMTVAVWCDLSTKDGERNRFQFAMTVEQARGLSDFLAKAVAIGIAQPKTSAN